jgi:hypothetical protein
MANNKTKRSKKDVIQALQTCKGLLSLAARTLHVTPQTLWNYRQRWPELEQVIVDAEQEMLDTAELALYSKINAGDAKSIMFFLKTKGKRRGYTERPTAPAENVSQSNWDLLAEEIPDGPLPDVIAAKTREPNDPNTMS